MAQDKTYLFDRPENVRRVLWLLYGAALLVLLLDLVVHRHSVHPWEWLPFFYPVYGFVGCVVLVLVAKWMRRLIMRPREYYQRDDLPSRPGSELPPDGEAQPVEERKAQ